MATTTGLSAEQIQAKIDELKAQGKTESNSKTVGKYVNALKVLKPEKYGAETVASAQKALSTSTQAPSTNQPSLSLPTVNSGNTGANAGLDINKVYDTAMADPALKTLEQQLKEKQTALDVARSTINDNPYYSEATRVGRISKLEAKANDELNTLNNQISQMKADAQVKVNLATKQYDINNQAYQQNLQRLNTLLASGGLSNASPSDIASVATSTGFTTGQIQGMIQQQKASQVKPQIQVDDNGNVTAFDVNTGKVLYSIGGIGKADNTNGGATKVTDKNIGEVIPLLKEADVITGNGPADQKLSEQEIASVKDQLMSIYGNQDTVNTLVYEAMKRAGFDIWRP